MKKVYIYLFILFFSSCFITYGDEQPIVSGQPKVITTTRVTIVNKSGQENVTEMATSKLLTVQTTSTTVIKSNGTTINAKTIGQVVGDVTHGSMAQKRVEVTNEILQGTTIEINGDDIIVNGEVAKDVNGNKYSSSNVIGSIYDVTVHSVNGQPTTILYDETDRVGSTNIVTYWINGKDTGISANLKITRTLIANNTTLSGTSIIQKQLFNDSSMPSTITFSKPNGYVDNQILDGYITTYTLNTEGENAGYYVSADGKIRFSAVLKRTQSIASTYYNSPPTYATEFETKIGQNFVKRDDFVFFSDNSFSSILYPMVKNTQNASVRPAYSFGENITVNTGNYYFVDDNFTGILASNTDRITQTYSPIDPVSKNEEIVQKNIETVISRNGTEILRGLNLGAKNISSLTKDGKTITGVFTYGDVIIATYGNQKAYGKTIVVKEGYVFLDGVNSNILESNATFQTKTCYYVDGKPTDVEKSENDSITNKIYYTNNNELTNIEKLDGDIINTEERTRSSSNQIIEKVIKVSTTNGNVYDASNATEYVSGYCLTLNNTNTRVYYNTKSTYTDDIIKFNGVDVGRRSEAEFYTVHIGTDKGIFAMQGNNPVQLVSDSDYSDTNIYLPRFDGYFFIVNGKMYHYQSNINSPLTAITIPSYPYSSYVFKKTQGSFVLFANPSNNLMFLARFTKLNYDSAYAANPSNYSLTNSTSYNISYVNNTLLFLPYACLNDISKTHCVSCFNSESNNFKSMAGFQGWGNFSYGVTKNGDLYYGSGHINNCASFVSGQKFKKIVLFGGSSKNGQYLALDTNNKVWFINGTSTASVINIDNGASIIDIDANRSGRGVAISNNAIYIIGNSGSTIFKYSTNYTPRDVVYGRSIVGVLTSDNRLWTADIPTSATNSQITWNQSPLRNVQEIGVVNNKVICRSQKISPIYQDIPMVRVNGKEYEQSTLTFEQNVELYVINGKKTMYRVSQNDTITTENSIMLTLINDGGQVSIKENQITNVETKIVSRAADGGILGIITTENGKYYINGNNTNINVNILDNISIQSRKTYYIGDINTGIEPETINDKIEIKGDYWEINGHNTTVKYYGLGEMCVRISDITPGEITENDTTETSTVVVPLVVRAQIVRFESNKPITSIRLQYRKLTDQNWTNLKVLTNEKHKLETNGIQSIFGRYVNVPVSMDQSFYIRINISDGTNSTVTSSALNPEEGNMFYYSFIRSSKKRVK